MENDKTTTKRLKMPIKRCEMTTNNSKETQNDYKDAKQTQMATK